MRVIFEDIFFPNVSNYSRPFRLSADGLGGWLAKVSGSSSESSRSVRQAFRFPLGIPREAWTSYHKILAIL